MADLVTLAEGWEDDIPPEMDKTGDEGLSGVGGIIRVNGNLKAGRCQNKEVDCLESQKPTVPLNLITSKRFVFYYYAQQTLDCNTPAGYD